MSEVRDFPLPVVRDSKSNVKEYSLLDWAYRVREELDEALAADSPIYRAEEIADTITVCVSWLNAMGYSEQARSFLFRKVNEKNKNRGYMEEFKCAESVHQ